MIKYINCNIVNAPVDIIAHCANCFNTFGCGVALEIKNKYPEIYKEDCSTKKGDRNKLGKVTIAYINYNIEENLQPKFGANLYGMYNYGRDSRKLNYEAIFSSLEGLKEQMLKFNLRSVAFPYKMGCMNAGGNWQIVEKMIEEVFKNSGIEVYICKNGK